jgi:hypothetical protein
VTVTIAPTESDIFRALGDFLSDVLPAGSEIIQAQDNRVPEPSAPNFVVMTPLRMPRLSTNHEEQASLGLEMKFTQSAEAVFQLDVHGPLGFQNAGIISTMLRSGYAVDFFASRNAAIAPLYCGDPRQMPFINAEKQYEDRYIVEANLQVNLTATTASQSARELALGLVDVETDPASWPNSTITATP